MGPEHEQPPIPHEPLRSEKKGCIPGLWQWFKNRSPNEQRFILSWLFNVRYKWYEGDDAFNPDREKKDTFWDGMP